MRHHKGGILKGLIKAGSKNKHHGKGHGHDHGRHGGHHGKMMKGRHHHKLHGHHGLVSARGESGNGDRTILDFHNRSLDFKTGGRNLRGRTALTVGVNLELCVMCGKCQRVCPADAITMSADGVRIDPDRCVGCGHCVESCKAGALFFAEAKEAATS